MYESLISSRLHPVESRRIEFCSSALFYLLHLLFWALFPPCLLPPAFLHLNFCLPLGLFPLESNLSPLFYRHFLNVWKRKVLKYHVWYASCDWLIPVSGSEYPNPENLPPNVFWSLCCTFGHYFVKEILNGFYVHTAIDDFGVAPKHFLFIFFHHAEVAWLSFCRQSRLIDRVELIFLSLICSWMFLGKLLTLSMC